MNRFPLADSESGSSSDFSYDDGETNSTDFDTELGPEDLRIVDWVEDEDSEHDEDKNTTNVTSRVHPINRALKEIDTQPNVDLRAYVYCNLDLFYALCYMNSLGFLQMSPQQQVELMKCVVVEEYQPGDIIFDDDDTSLDLYFVVASEATWNVAKVEVIANKLPMHNMSASQEKMAERFHTKLQRGQYFGQHYFLTREFKKRDTTIRIPMDSPVPVAIGKISESSFDLLAAFRKVLLVKSVPLIQVLPENIINMVLEKMVVKSFKDKELIFRKGEPGKEFFVVLEGAVTIMDEINVHESGIIEIIPAVTLREGHFFGEMCLTNPGGLRNASVAALGPVTCVSIAISIIENALESQRFSMMLARVIEQRQRSRDTRIEALQAARHRGTQQRRKFHSTSPTAVKVTSKLKLRKLASGDRLINKYLILKEIGKGSFGEVYLCKEEEGGTLYAMKSLTKRENTFRDPTAKRAIDREIAVMKNLRHENIVCLHEVIDDPSAKKIYLVQEYCELGPIMPDLENSRPIEAHLIKKYFRGIIKGLSYLHSEGIIHRDIKPQNLLLSEGGVLKIADFGAAVFTSGPDKMQGGGTPAFMAPELFLTEADASANLVHKSPAVDIFAVGATLFCMVFGHPPWMAPNQVDLANKIKSEELTFPDKPIDPHLKHLLRRMLEKNALMRCTLDEIVLDDWVCDEGGNPLFVDNYFSADARAAVDNAKASSSVEQQVQQPQGKHQQQVRQHQQQQQQQQQSQHQQQNQQQHGQDDPQQSQSALPQPHKGVEDPQTLKLSSVTSADKLDKMVENSHNSTHDDVLYAAIQDDRLANMRVLIIDDSIVARKMMSVMLKKLNMHDSFIVTCNEENALDQMKLAIGADKVFDAVIVDYHMPSKSGPEVCAELREMGYTGRIIGISALDRGLTHQNFFKMGADAVLTKPLKQNRLVKVLLSPKEEVKDIDDQMSPEEAKLLEENSIITANPATIVESSTSGAPSVDESQSYVGSYTTESLENGSTSEKSIFHLSDSQQEEEFDIFPTNFEFVLKSDGSDGDNQEGDRGGKHGTLGEQEGGGNKRGNRDDVDLDRINSKTPSRGLVRAAGFAVGGSSSFRNNRDNRQKSGPILRAYRKQRREQAISRSMERAAASMGGSNSNLEQAVIQANAQHNRWDKDSASVTSDKRTDDDTNSTAAHEEYNDLNDFDVDILLKMDNLNDLDGIFDPLTAKNLDKASDPTTKLWNYIIKKEDITSTSSSTTTTTNTLSSSSFDSSPPPSSSTSSPSCSYTFPIQCKNNASSKVVYSNPHLGVTVSGAEDIGIRTYMEDRSVIQVDLFRNDFPVDMAFLGVFDGHGGQYVADMLQSRLHKDFGRAFYNCIKEKYKHSPSNHNHNNNNNNNDNNHNNCKDLLHDSRRVGSDQSTSSLPPNSTVVHATTSGSREETTTLANRSFSDLLKKEGRSEQKVQADDVTEPKQQKHMTAATVHEEWFQQHLKRCLFQTCASLDREIITNDYARKQDRKKAVYEATTYAGSVAAFAVIYTVAQFHDECKDDDDNTSSPTTTPLTTTSTTTTTSSSSSSSSTKPAVKMVVGNVGDCRVVLSSNGVATQLTIDHTALLDSEKKRIVNAGGFVSANDRVNGLLAVSRSFGDIEHKIFGLVRRSDGKGLRGMGPDDNDVVEEYEFEEEIPGGLWASDQQVISKPTLLDLDVLPEHEFVIIASDGLWDAVSNQEAVNYVRWRLLSGNYSNMQQIVTDLVAKASAWGSGDNVSVIICCLNQKFEPGAVTTLSDIHGASADTYTHTSDASSVTARNKMDVGDHMLRHRVQENREIFGSVHSTERKVDNLVYHVQQPHLKSVLQVPHTPLQLHMHTLGKKNVAFSECVPTRLEEPTHTRYDSDRQHCDRQHSDRQHNDRQQMNSTTQTSLERDRYAQVSVTSIDTDTSGGAGARVGAGAGAGTGVVSQTAKTINDVDKSVMDTTKQTGHAVTTNTTTASSDKTSSGQILNRNEGDSNEKNSTPVDSCIIA